LEGNLIYVPFWKKNQKDPEPLEPEKFLNPFMYVSCGTETVQIFIF
jgi:hypothetical protein